MEQLKQSSPLTVNDFKINVNMGVILQRQGHYAKAETFFSQAVDGTNAQSQPLSDVFAAHFNFGLNHMHLSKLSEAAAQFKAALGTLKPPQSQTQEQRTHAFHAHMNLALIYEQQGQRTPALEHVQQCLAIDPNNKQMLALKLKLQRQEQEASAQVDKVAIERAAATQKAEKQQTLQPDGGKKIVQNHPNAESLSNHHSRKSSAVVRDIISAKSTKSKEQIAKILNDGAKNKAEEESKDFADEGLAALQINVDLQPIELTAEEEQNHADAEQTRQRESSVSNAGARDHSPDQLLARQAYSNEEPPAKAQQPTVVKENAWKHWTAQECEAKLTDPTARSKARFRLGEIHQNNLEFDKAVGFYEKLTEESPIFLKEKTLMRLAECCYRCNQTDKGLAFLTRLEREIRPNQIYTISLLKGKYNDLKKQFAAAADNFDEASVLYSRDFADQVDPSIVGNI